MAGEKLGREVDLRFDHRPVDEVVLWVLSMDSHCDVVKPKELRARKKVETDAVAMKYRKARSGSTREG